MGDSDYGGQTMVGRLRRVLVRPPDASFGEADPARWHYAERPDLGEARREHAALVALLAESAGPTSPDTITIHGHPEPLPDHADAIFVYDPLLMTDRGAVLLRMGKRPRRGEEDAMAATLERLGVPILGRLEPPATAEGGDLLWLDRDTLAIGRGFRTNRAAERQLSGLLTPLGVTLLPVELPVFEGPGACLHLMSLISLVDTDLAVVFPPLLSVPFWQRLQARGIALVEVPEAEFRRHATNVLAVAPRDAIMLEGNPVTRACLEAAGCRVRTYPGRVIAQLAEGGPTCLTRPLWRSDAGRFGDGI